MLRLRAETIPLPLKKNDKVQIVASSSVIDDGKSLLSGIEILNQWGLICSVGDVIGRRWGYLAGDDETRFKELHHDQTTPLQAFARGGWGAARLLEKPQPWKKGWLLGYSDVSSILISRLSKGFHGGIHGPLVTSLHSEPEWSKERLRSLLFGHTVADLIGEPWHEGIAKGPLVVANLTVITHLLGSRHLPNLDGAILILEDIGEAPYRIDRMLTQWRLAGILQRLSGLGFGSFTDCIEEGEIDLTKNFNILDVLQDRTQDLDIPIVFNLPIGHRSGNASLPLGELAILNGNKGILRLIS